MYEIQPTQFGFTQSSMGVLPTTLDNVNPAYYSQIAAFLIGKFGSPANVRLASVNGVVLYDTLRVDAGVLPTRDFVFFTTPVGATQNTFIGGVGYTKQEIDIHPWLTNGGQLSKGYEALVWSIGVQFHVVSSLDESLQVAPSNAANLTLDPGIISGEANTDPVKMGNIMRAYQEGLYFELFVNQTTFELGPGWRFPSGPYGISGATALNQTVAVAADRVASEGWANNGFGWAYQMPVMRHLPELTKFGVRMKVQNPFGAAGTLPVRIVVTLEGIGVQPVTG